jgi:hypothetical protein
MILGERREGPDEIFDVDVSLFLAVLRSPVWPIVRAYFKARVGVEDAIMIPMNTLVRRFVPNEDRNEDIRIPFHQDAFGFPDTFMAVNCWVLMSPDECGMTAPGLEFIPDRLDHMIPLEKNPATKHYGFLETSHEVIERMLAIIGLGARQFNWVTLPSSTVLPCIAPTCIPNKHGPDTPRRSGLSPRRRTSRTT